MRRSYFIFGILFLVSAVVISCSTPKTLAKQNVSHVYRMDDHKVNPEYTVFHTSEDSSELIFRFTNDRLLYAKLNEGDYYISRVRLRCYVHSSYSNSQLLDSAQIVLIDTIEEKEPRLLFGSTKVRAPFSGEYVVRVVFEDLNRGRSEEFIFPLKKEGERSAQHFLAKRNIDGVPICDHVGRIDEPVELSFSKSIRKTVYIKHYKRDFGLAPPPFANYSPSRFDFTPDSLVVLEFDDLGQLTFEPWSEGMYHFSLDTSDFKGYTLVVHDKGYPRVSSAKKMAAPVRFLTSNKEFNELSDTNALRKKVESFWLDRTNNDKERAKELIQDFYGRIEYANTYFSCHQEGWQTDRGMIYLIFGAPEAIFKSEKGETWNYGDGGGQSELTFTFSKVGNPFSNNDFRLSRSPSYKTYWYSAVEAWRMGRAYAY